MDEDKRRNEPLKKENPEAGHDHPNHYPSFERMEGMSEEEKKALFEKMMGGKGNPNANKK